MRSKFSQSQNEDKINASSKDDVDKMLIAILINIIDTQHIPKHTLPYRRHAVNCLLKLKINDPAVHFNYFIITFLITVFEINTGVGGLTVNPVPFKEYWVLFLNR